MQVTFIFILSAYKGNKGLTKYTKSEKVRLFKALIAYILHTIVNTHGSEQKDGVFTSSDMMNHIGMRKKVERKVLTSCRISTR